MNISSKIISISAIGIAVAAFVPAVFAETTSFVPSLGPTSESVVVVVPSNPGSNSSESGTTLTPSNPGSNGPESGTTLVPTNSGSNGPESGNTLVPTLGGQNGDEGSVTPTDTTPVPPVVTTSSGGGSSGGGFAPSYLAVVPPTTSCPLITTFMTLGDNNNSAEVAKLQSFLKDTENLDVDVNGIFDQKTSDAISAFQIKYRSDILGPWGASLASGRVYITTLKKINELACQSPLTLSADELAVINAYKNRSTTGTSTTPIVGENTNGNVNSSTSTPTTPSEIGSNGTGSENTAAAGNTSVFGRFWNFLKNIF